MKHAIKNMAIAVCMSLSVAALTGCKPSVSQNEKDAVVALKKLEARVQTGINRPDYIAALGETTFAVNLLGDEKSSKNQELDGLIRAAMADYKLAGEVWKVRIETTINPREGKAGAIRLTDAAAQSIVSQFPAVNKPMSEALLAQRKKNDYISALATLNVGNGEKPQPLNPKPGDGAVFVEQGNAQPPEANTVVIGGKQEPIQYLDLEVATHLLWMRAEESLAKAYAMTSN